ncbi:amine dehydrogenase [Candidatus Binatia bacterium]|nr:amine dehydrogenase [Candidatus Binatia bacterium]
MIASGKRRALALAAAVVVGLCGPAAAQVAPEAPGRIETLAQPPSAHWAWAGDPILGRAGLVDLDSGRFLGQINGGYGIFEPLFARRRPEIYVPATYYSRRTHGTRTDVIEIYDRATLTPVHEVVIPPKRAIDAFPMAHAAVSDDERFAAVFNWTPATSLSIVDLDRRTFVGEIEIPGCSLVYAAGPRRFMSLCSNGELLLVSLDDTGKEAGKVRTQPFFDPQTDPVTEKAVRIGDEWIFVSFEGTAHPVDVSSSPPRFPASWPLLTDADRAESWRIGGLQHLAVHAPSKRLYSLVHRGGADTHKEPGEEVWIYDLTTRQRVRRIDVRYSGLTAYGMSLAFGRNWVWPFNGLYDWVVDGLVPAAVTHITVTRDEAPLLATVSAFSGIVAVYDAGTGAFLRRTEPVAWTVDSLQAPWSGR